MPPYADEELPRNINAHKILNVESGIGQDEKPWLFEDALKLIGFGRVQYISIILGGLVLLAVINETMGMMMIITSAQCDLNLTSSDKGIISAAGFLGIMLPAYLWGYLSDTKGRKGVMLYTLFITNAAAVLSSLAPNLIVFVICRFFVGFFISAASSSIYAYIGEFNRIKNRQSIIAWASLSVGLASIYIAGVAWLILSFDWRLQIVEGFDYRPWRLLLVFYTLPGFVSALILCYFPESPRFYLVNGKEEKALKILNWIYRVNTREDDQCFPVKKLIPEMEQVQKKANVEKGIIPIIKSMWKQTKPLLQGKNFLNLSISCYMMFAAFFASGGIGVWFADIQNKVSTSNTTGTICELLKMATPNISTANELEICDDTVPNKVYIDAMTLGAYYLIGMTLISLCIKKIGRGWILAFCLFISGACGIALLWLTDPSITILSFSMFLTLSGVCISVITNGAVMLFPTHVRAMAVTLILVCGRFGTAVGSNIVGVLIESNCEATFTFYSIVLLVAGLLNFLLPLR